MNHTDTNWLPGLLMLAAGAIAALAYVFGSRRPAADAKAGGDDDLDARYQAKLEQLRDHHASRHLQKPDEWEATRVSLEREAAAVLKEQSGLKHERAKAASRAEQRAAAKAKDSSFAAKNPTLTGGLIGGAVVGFFVLLGFNLTQSTESRKEGMQATGGTTPGRGDPAAEEEDPRLTALGRRVQANPEDPEAVGELTMYLVRRQAFDDARPLIDRLTQLDPYSVKGRVARGVMRAVNGDAKGAEEELEHLSAYYPEGYDAFMFAGLIATETNELPRAVRNLEAYLAAAPPAEQPPMLRGLVAELKQGRVPR